MIVAKIGMFIHDNFVFKLYIKQCLHAPLTLSYFPSKVHLPVSAACEHYIHTYTYAYTLGYVFHIQTHILITYKFICTL